jgi:T4-like virus Myoviridae tail sheath stabiliser
LKDEVPKIIDQGPFYHATLRKTVVAFGTIFNNIRLVRVDDLGVGVQTLKVPLSYGTKQKSLVRIRQDPDLQTRHKIEITVPRLGFEITNIAPDRTRQIGVTSQSKKVNQEDTALSSLYNPAPYDVHFSLYILTKNQDDGMQILEQILPFFRPEYVLTVNDIPELELTHDLPISLLGVGYEDDYQGNFDTRTAIIWTLSFVAKVNFFGPVQTQGVIKTVKETFIPNMPGFPSLHAERLTTSVDPLSAGPTDAYNIVTLWEDIDSVTSSLLFVNGTTTTGAITVAIT